MFLFKVNFSFLTKVFAVTKEGASIIPPAASEDPFTKWRLDKLFFFCSMVYVFIN